MVFVATLNLMSGAQAEDRTQIIFIDGQYRVIRVPVVRTVKSTQPAPNMQLNESMVGGFVDLWPEANKFISYKAEADRMAQARAQAEEKAKVSIESGNRYAIVPVTADKPLQLLEEPEAYRYRAGRAEAGDDYYKLLESAFGPAGAQITNPTEAVETEERYLRYVLLAERMPNGEIDYRNLTKDDQESYVNESSRRAEAQNRELAEKARTERMEQQKKYEQLEQSKRQAQQAEYERAQKQKRDEEAAAEKRADEERARRETLAEKSAARDKECASGRSIACIFKDDETTREYEFAQKMTTTSYCMAPSIDTPAPRSGPCAPGAPPCKVCSYGANLDKQQVYETYISAGAIVQSKLPKGYKAQDFDRAMGDFLNSGRSLDQYGLRYFDHLMLNAPSAAGLPTK